LRRLKIKGKNRVDYPALANYRLERGTLQLSDSSIILTIGVIRTNDKRDGGFPVK
jgi:hypothetical protein